MVKEVFKPVPTHAGIISILFIVIPLVALDVILKGSNIMHPAVMPLLFAIFVIILIMGVIAYGYFGMRYVVDDEGVVIWWGILKKRVPFTDIVDTYFTGGTNGTKNTRIVGCEVPGCHFGLFRTKDTGKIHLCITDPNRVFVIETGRCKFGVTPANMDEFAGLVNARIQKNTDTSNSDTRSSNTGT